VEIDDKRVGLITYHRTDSTRLSRKGINLLRKYVKEHFPEEYLPKRGRTFGRDRGNVQGAHEAIRPTYPDITPESLKGKIDDDLVKLYDIIWRRAIASQMAPLRYERREVILEAGGVKFKAEGRKITFDGWSRIISTLFRRKYVYRRGKALAPTDRGEKVLNELLKDFPDIFEYEFTAKMEENLDRIEEGKETYDHLIKEFYKGLKPKLDKASES